MAIFFPDGIPPLTAAEQRNKVVYTEHYQTHTPEEILRDPVLLPFPPTAIYNHPHDPQGPEESLRQWDAKRLNVKANLHERYFPVGMHSHEGMELLCVLRGSCPHRVADTLGTLHEGDVLLIAPGTPHAFLDIADNCLVYNLELPLNRFEAAFQPVLHSRSQLATFLLKTLYTGSRNSWMLFHLGGYFRGESALAGLDAVWRNPGAFLAERLNAMAQMFFFDLMERSIVPPEVSLDPVSGGSNRAQVVVAYARSRTHTVTVQELADVFGYSTRQISRLFHQATGQSCIQYIQSCREEQFLSLLLSTDISIGRALELSGIRSTSQYFAAFRRKFGMTPAEYRQAHRKR